jgi:adenine-specific DNA-methyltransferase
MLMQLTRHELGDHADFTEDLSSFTLRTNPLSSENVHLGLYELPRRSGEAHLYRLAHPLAQSLLKNAKDRRFEPMELTFDLSTYPAQVTALNSFIGQSGDLRLHLMSVTALDQPEDHLILCGCTDDGAVMDEEILHRLLMLPVKRSRSISNYEPRPQLDLLRNQKHKVITSWISERNIRFFEEEAAKLEAWAEDVKQALEQDIKDLDREIRESKRSARLVGSLEEKLKGQREIKSLETKRNQKRLLLFEAQDKVDAQRDDLIARIESQLEQQRVEKELFTIRWRLV